MWSVYRLWELRATNGPRRVVSFEGYHRPMGEWRGYPSRFHSIIDIVDLVAWAGE